MKTYTYLLTLWLVATPWALRAEELPIAFARSGQKVTLSVGGDDGKIGGSVTLWTFGQQWGEPVALKSGAVEVVAPRVRVPVVFRLIPTHDSKVVLGELVVYPDRPIPWDKDTQLVAVGTPDWFDTWSKAVGLPIKKFKELESLNSGNWRMLEKPALLILGRKGDRSNLPERPGGYFAQIRPVSFFRLAAEHKINVLVLETDWFRGNETISREIVLSPKHMTGALADLQTQNWSLPPAFRQRAVRISNRQTWIAGPEYPLVEEIRSRQGGTESFRMVWSCLPWQQQLGRTEMADELFLRLLTETAKGAKDRPPLDGRWRLLYPTAKDIKAGECPVLAAALKSAEANVGNEAESRGIRAYVLDLRGKKSPPSDFFEGTGAARTIEARIGTQSPLLILGDNPILDTWKWLELDRSHHRSPRPGVLWWPDNSLPPSIDSQLRLMQLFTEWNISLETISQE
jgi:hypothetical protein